MRDKDLPEVVYIYAVFDCWGHFVWEVFSSRSLAAEWISQQGYRIIPSTELPDRERYGIRPLVVDGDVRSVVEDSTVLELKAFDEAGKSLADCRTDDPDSQWVQP